MFISITFHLLLNISLYGRIFLYLHLPYYTGFLSVICPLMEAFSSSMLRISSCSTFLPFIEFYKYNSSYKWRCFYQIYSSRDLVASFCSSSIGWTICTRLQARRFQRLLVQRLDCSDWLYLPMDFDYSHVHEFSRPFLGQIHFKFYLVHWSDKYALNLFFIALSLFRGKLIDVAFLRPETLFVLGLQPSCG